MALVPALRVVPVASVMRHEHVDPLRVADLRSRIEAERVQVNPVICVEVEGSGFVVLDGATRTEAIRGLGLPYLVVQLVDPAKVTLETWHHVVRDCPVGEVMERLRSQEGLIFSTAEGTPRVTTVDGSRSSVLGSDLSPNATMSALVGSYIGQWHTSRIINPDPEWVTRRFPDWSVVVEFPPLEIKEVIKAALGQDLLPAGVTRFVVPERALRLNADIALLEQGDIEGKQHALETLVETRSRSGRVRRYEETVIVLDD
jgi:hypothetical protein